ncbi:MAG: efflux RND transporter periplasmic adaptor subunit [Flavobacteriales bacterium]|nr:efflux RND transporter periplasmic adaptor subunit [Flavobacteriales bacterium]
MKFKLLIISFLTVGFLGSCSTKHKSLEEEQSFLATKPILLDTFLDKDYVCQIQSINHIELRALEKGYIQEIYVDEGKFVKKGQLLFQILPNIYEAEMNKALAEKQFAEIEYSNTKALAEKKVVSPNELALAKAKLDKALAELSLSQTHLQFTQVRAPFDGIIDRFYVRKGSIVEEGDLLTYLSDNSKMWVYFNVSEAEYLNYKKNLKKDSTLKVKLEMANHEMFPFEGNVETIEADFNNETGNISFRATFPNPDRLLRHGETGLVKIATQLNKALIIPQKATYEVLDKKFVYIIDQHHKVIPKQITITAELPHLYVIKGLAEKDVILLEGLRKVKENQEIHYKFLEPRHVISNLSVHAE